MITILLSDLAVEQLQDMPQQAGRQLLKGMERLRVFPESAPPLTRDNYEAYRQVLAGSYRAIYRFDSDDGVVKVYCILHKRRRLPSAEFLKHQIF